MKTKILIGDDHGIFRAGIIALLKAEPEFEVVGEAADGDEMVHKVEALRPDIVLMDISMPGINGIEATHRVKEKHPATKVLILTVHEERGFLQDAIQSGACGYLLKRALGDELFIAIQTVMRGEIYVHPIMVRTLLQGPPVSAGLPPTKLELLTQREIQVLSLVAQGYTNLQISKQLHITTRTVEFHRSNINDKLNLHSRVDLVRYATENGLVQFSPLKMDP